MRCIFMNGGLRLAFCFLIVTAAVAAEIPKDAPVPVLNAKTFKLMDVNHDAKVSEDEFVEYGKYSLAKQKKRANITALERKFATFDRNADGFITAEDPTAQSPTVLLIEQLKGTWSGKKSNGKTIVFVFWEDFSADLIQSAKSMQKQVVEVGGKMTYKFYKPGTKPVAVDITAKPQIGPTTTIKCIIKFISDNKIMLRMASGTDYVALPRSFPEKGADQADTLTLIRTTTN